MSTLTYNTVSIQTLDVRSMVSETVYDEGDQSNSHTRTTILAVGTLQGTDAADFAAKVADARKKLMVPRANFNLTLGGQTIFDITAPDDMGGPKPRRLEINEQTGVFAIVTFEIELNLTECASGTPNNVVSHRYAVINELDERFMTRRILRGSILVREAASSNNPDALRGLITPRVPQGFVRKSATFIVTPDGMRLEYEIVDEEVYRIAPSPAVRASGTFSESMTENMFWFRAFHIELEGTKTSSKAAMLDAAFQIAKSRIDFVNFEKERIVQMKVEERLYENVISLQVVSQVFDIQTNDNYVYPSTSNLLKQLPVGTEPQNAPDPGPYGTAMIAAAKQTFFRPCTDSASPGSAQHQSDSSSGASISTVVANDGTLPGTDSPTLIENTPNPYLFYEEEIATEQDNGVILLPSSSATVGSRVYQLHTPVARVIQRGRASRLGAAVQVPLPRHRSDSVVSKFKPIHFAPQLSQDKKNFIYTAAWEYVLLVPYSNVGQMVDTVDGFRDTNDQVPKPIPRNAAAQPVHTAAVLIPGYSMSPGGADDQYPL